MDLFAQALLELYETGQVTLYVERDDGFIDEDDLSWYLTSFAEFPRFEKRALKLARGRVLDVGCAAGRHALYLQRRGLEVTGIDSSPLLVQLAQARGLSDVRVVNGCEPLPFRSGEFDTILLFGNNLGLCGNPIRFRHMLRELNRITAPAGQILATTRMLSVTKPLERDYIRRNLARGRAPAQVRLRLLWNGHTGKWFDLLLFAPTDLMVLAAPEGWELVNVFADVDMTAGYAVVLEKAAPPRRR
ncbi:MAG: class I SAM-dependent methyltransferase [Chloroflexi bacterium]|nr:class I SAM-dependent methyltransferase [Chloroflexota bacterium]